VLFLEMKANQGNSSKVISMDQRIKRVVEKDHKVFQEYSLEQIRTFLDLELPLCKKKREKYDNERVLMKQLLSNIERNRNKLRKEYFEAEALSHSSKLAVKGIKEKLDHQGSSLGEELEKIKDKGDQLRKKEEKIRLI